MYKKSFRLYGRSDVRLLAGRNKEDGEPILKFTIEEGGKTIRSKPTPLRYRVIVIIHKTEYDSVKDYIKKIKKIIAELKNFYFFLNDELSIDYSHKVWLNKNSSPSTGSLVCYYGLTPHKKRKENIKTLFIELSDCQSRFRIYFPTKGKKYNFKTKDRTFKDIKKLFTHLETYVKYVEENYV
jgi:hypothetical protein